jgi:type IV secretory pathway protease TraF
MLNLILIAGLTVASLQPVDTSPRPIIKAARQRSIAPLQLLNGPRRRSQSVFEWDGRWDGRFPSTRRDPR